MKAKPKNKKNKPPEKDTTDSLPNSEKTLNLESLKTLVIDLNFPNLPVGIPLIIPPNSHL